MKIFLTTLILALAFQAQAYEEHVWVKIMDCNDGQAAVEVQTDTGMFPQFRMVILDGDLKEHFNQTKAILVENDVMSFLFSSVRGSNQEFFGGQYADWPSGRGRYYSLKRNGSAGGKQSLQLKAYRTQIDSKGEGYPTDILSSWTFDSCFDVKN